MDKFIPLFPQSVPQTDRVWRTEIGGYNQVIALTQFMINQGIHNFYTYLELNNKLPPPADLQPDPNQSIKAARFAAPSIIVEASASNFTSVKLILRLRSGTANIIQKFVEANDDKPYLMEMASLKLTDMVTTVPCNVDCLELDQNTDRGKEMKKRMRAGDHSIYQLLVDLASAAWGDSTWDYGLWTEDDWVTTFNGADKEKIQKRPDGFDLGKPRIHGEVGTQLKTGIETFFKILARKFVSEGMLTMGYAKRYDQPTQKPTFEVNDVRFQTYPWTESNNAGIPAGISGKGRLNYLCYLEAVGQNRLPPAHDQSQSILKVTGEDGKRRGNWTDGVDPKTDSPTSFGNFVLSSSCFLENYFLPKLENINRLMRFEITDVNCTIDASFADWHTKTFYSSEISKDYDGQNKPSNPEYAFKRETFQIDDSYDGDCKSWFNDWTQNLPAGTLQWNWNHVRKAKSPEDIYKHVGSVEEWIWSQSMTHTRVFIVPGANRVFVQGKSWSKINYKIDPSIIEFNVYGGFIVRAKWHIIFTMKELTDGGLYFDIQSSSTETDVPWNAKGDGNTWPSNIQNQYADAGKNFEFICNGLRTALNGQERFVMPSSGVYFFKNPIFDHNGALICELEYNGVGQDGNLPTNQQGIRDPNIARPDFQSFEKARTADSTLIIPKK